MSWDPFEEMKKVHREVDKLFSDFFGKPKASQEFREPLIDICETNDKNFSCCRYFLELKNKILN